MDRKEQIQRAKELLECGVLSKETADAIKADFPELAESEDERIRKDITRVIKEWWQHGSCAPGFSTEDEMLAYLEKQKEQKPAEWSEEDNEMLKTIDRALCNASANFGLGTIRCPYDDARDWLKSLRPQPHWKPSNHELGALRTAISILTEERNFQRAGKHLQDILDHFEGKETRHDWKPSELQMFALDSAILMCHNLKRGGDKEELQSLYNDLKKL